MPLLKDLLHPSPEEEKRKHKKKRLVQSPNSYFMDVKCPGEAPAWPPSSRSGHLGKGSPRLRPTCWQPAVGVPLSSQAGARR